jgi:REP element-mobilizing transposase RayT
MIVGTHLIFSAYGFWLPNDPRGSWSTFVGVWELFRAGGAATKTTETRSVAGVPHDRAKRLATKEALSRPPVSFSDDQRAVVGAGIGFYARKAGLPARALAVMPDHVHIAYGRFRLAPDVVAAQLKAAATRHLADVGLHPFQGTVAPGKPPLKCWARGEWKVYLDPDDVLRTVVYVEGNPAKAGLPPQRWDFVTAPPR